MTIADPLGLLDFDQRVTAGDRKEVQNIPTVVGDFLGALGDESFSAPAEVVAGS